MPRQKGPLKIKGTIDGLTYYEMDGNHLVRRKTSLNKKRVSTDPAFTNSRKASAVFAQASVIASSVYHTLPSAKRKHGVIGKLTGMANKLLREGKSEEEVRVGLEKIEHK
jgi:hypothetical protein